jgi:hypothetical protein
MSNPSSEFDPTMDQLRQVLNPEFDAVMDQLRQLEINPNKLAAISAILLSEQLPGDDESATEVARLDRAFGWICAAIDEVDDAAGIRVKMSLDAVRETLDGLGYDVETEKLVNGMVVSKAAWDDPDAYNAALRADEGE